MAFYIVGDYMIIHCKYDSLVNPKDLKNHPKNRNMHGQDQIERLAELYKYHGIRHPIIVSNRSKCIVAGHGRKLAAIRAGIKEVPVVYQDFESNEAEYAFIQADNAIALWAELDMSGINSDIGDLCPDFDINMLGIQDFTIDVAEKDFEGDPDEIPEEVEPQAKLGQIYKLGVHRLMCGSSTDENDVAKLFDGKKPVLMVTDPPYGVEYEAGWRAEAKGVKKTKREETSSLKNDDQADWFDAYNLSQADVAYVWHASAFTDVVMDGLKKSGFKIKQQIIWNKSVHALSRSDYHWKHEPCWYAVKDESHWNGDRTQKTVWDIQNVAFEKDKTNHPTQKPVKIYEIPYENNSKKGDIVYDPFSGSGSGSGLIAAEKTERVFLGMELDPKFIDTIIARWEKFTGKKAELISG